jgi:two-component system sensor histidine kinase/response regulator
MLAPELAGARVLLVEDNPINQEVACGLLEILGLTVDVAGDGEQAVTKSAAGRYDLILMDVQMPVVDGLQATAMIRGLPDRADVPIIAMTADATPSDRERCVAAGMNDHIAKPIGLNTLVPTLSRWLRPGTPFSSTAAARDPVPVGTQLAGVDVRLGMKIAAGDPVAFHDLMGRFAEFTVTDVAQLRRRLEAGEVAEAIRRAHSVAGSAAMVGATDVARSASTVLSQLRGGVAADSVLPLVTDLERVLSSLVAELDRVQAAR